MEKILSTKEVAELLGYEPSVVSNWKKRYKNFPEPVATNRPAVCYDIEQVIDWIEARGARMIVEPEEAHRQYINELRYKVSQ